MKTKNLKIPLIGLLVLALILTNLSCKKDPAKCFDQELFNKSKDKPCPTDCPGVVGCDDRTYCNECEASKNGIRVK